MKRMFLMMVIAMITMFSATSFAFTPPPAPADGWYVADLAGKFSTDQLKSLNQKIEGLNKSTRNEYAILLLQDMDGDNIEDVAHATFNAWGVGKDGLDNGVLIVVAVKERKSRIETGKGVGGELPDLRANDILKQNLNPYLKAGDFYGGFNSTLDAVSAHLEARANEKANPRSSGCDVVGADSGAPVGGLIVLLVLGTGLLTLFLVMRATSRARTRKVLADFERGLKQREIQAREAREVHLAQVQREKLLREEKRLAAEQTALQARAIDSMKRVAPKLEPLPEPIKAAPKPKATSVTTPKPAAVPRPVSKPTILASVAPVAVIADLQAQRDKARRDQEARNAREEAERQQRARDEADRRRREDDDRRRRQQEDDDRRRRQQEDDDRRRRQQEDDDRRSSYSPPSFDWGGSSSSDSGSGFGGGDSGGGGSSSDW